MHHLSAIELREKFRTGETSAEVIVRHFLARIAQYDGQIGAFLRTSEERALNQAKALDAKRKAGGKLGSSPQFPSL